MSKSAMVAIYGGEQLTLSGNLRTRHLIVHMSTPPAVVERAGFDFTYDDIEVIGVGSFEIRNHGVVVRRLEQKTSRHLRIVK